VLISHDRSARKRIFLKVLAVILLVLAVLSGLGAALGSAGTDYGPTVVGLVAAVGFTIASIAAGDRADDMAHPGAVPR